MLDGLHKNCLVKKFGGTSVGTLERIEAVALRLKADFDRGEKFVVVVSAMSGETNRLVALADAVFQGERGLAYDMLVASGEQVSVALLSLALQKQGLSPKPLLAFQLGIQTDSSFSRARIQHINGKYLGELVAGGFIPVVAGFQGVSRDDEITTLGRGGSDTTAVALAAALGSEICEIYTDVPAVFTADPRMVPQAREIAVMSFDEMMEMASLGSKVLHTRSVEIAAKYNIKIHLRSSFEERQGSWIISEAQMLESPVVTAVTVEKSQLVTKLKEFALGTKALAQLFRRLADAGVVVDIITQSDSHSSQSLAFSAPAEDRAMVRNILQAEKIVEQNIVELSNVAKISVVGVGMRHHTGVAAKFFSCLAESQIDVHLVSTSEIKISAIIDEAQVQGAVQQLHKVFELDQRQSSSP